MLQFHETGKLTKGIKKVLLVAVLSLHGRAASAEMEISNEAFHQVRRSRRHPVRLDRNAQHRRERARSCVRRPHAGVRRLPASVSAHLSLPIEISVIERLDNEQH